MYINVETKEILTNFDIIRSNPNVNFPNMSWTDEILAPFGYAELHYPSEHPFPGRYEMLVDGEPIQAEDGKWYRTFVIQSLVPLSEEDKVVFLEEEKKKLRQEAADKRYEKEVSGILVDGLPINTSRESQAMITAAFAAFKNGLLTTINWKCSNGTWITLDETQFASIAQAVIDHVQVCFSEEQVKTTEIDALATCEDLVQYSN